MLFSQRISMVLSFVTNGQNRPKIIQILFFYQNQYFWISRTCPTQKIFHDRVIYTVRRKWCLVSEFRGCLISSQIAKTDPKMIQKSFFHHNQYFWLSRTCSTQKIFHNRFIYTVRRKWYLVSELRECLVARITTLAI